MAFLGSIALGSIAVIYASLRILLYMTQDAKEPPAILTGVPFLGPIPGMLFEKAAFYLRLRDQYNLPIYTLRLPFQRIYVINALELVPTMQKNWKTVSFSAIAADAGAVVGISKRGLDIMHKDLTEEEGFSVSWPRYIVPSMSPGKDLDSINRRAIEVLTGEVEKKISHGTSRVGLFEWSKRVINNATTEAVYGPANPYRDAAVAEAWDFLTFAIYPMISFFFPHLWRARELAAHAMIDYMRKGGHKDASGLVHKRYEHHVDKFGFDLEDVARGELGNTFAVLGNTTPAAVWVLYQIFSDQDVLEDVRGEVSHLVQEKDGISHIDLTGIRTSCPVLLSVFQETLRFRSVTAGPRVILEDTLLEGGILLKKGGMLFTPAPVLHTSTSAWGNDAKVFDHLRFSRKSSGRKTNRMAFRAFGGGHGLCPGRHFASTEIMAFAALMVLQFDITPEGGKWIEPTWHKSPLQAGIPVPDQDIEVDIKPRDPNMKWSVTFTGSDEAMVIVSEDIKAE